MTIEQKLAYRQLMSDIMQYMSEPGRSEHDILQVLDRLEKQLQKFISGVIQIMVPGAQPWEFTAKDRMNFRSTFAVCLDRIAQPDLRPEILLQVIDSLETWMDNKLDEGARAAMGKPKMKIIKLPNQN